MASIDTQNMGQAHLTGGENVNPNAASNNTAACNDTQNAAVVQATGKQVDTQTTGTKDTTTTLQDALADGRNAAPTQATRNEHTNLNNSTSNGIVDSPSLSVPRRMSVDAPRPQTNKPKSRWNPFRRNRAENTGPNTQVGFVSNSASSTDVEKTAIANAGERGEPAENQHDSFQAYAQSTDVVLLRMENDIKNMKHDVDLLKRNSRRPEEEGQQAHVGNEENQAQEVQQVQGVQEVQGVQGVQGIQGVQGAQGVQVAQELQDVQQVEDVQNMQEVQARPGKIRRYFRKMGNFFRKKGNDGETNVVTVGGEPNEGLINRIRRYYVAARDMPAPNMNNTL